MKKNRLLFLLSAVATPAIISSCGGYESPIAPYYQAATTTTTQQSCCCTCQKSTTGSKDTASSSKPATSSTPKPSATPKDTTGGTVTDTKTDTTSNAADAKEKGRKILDTLMNKISKAGAMEVVVDKSEKVLATGEVITSGIHLWARSPNLVKLEMTAHSKKASSVGTKILYTSDSGKVKVRPAGILSIVTTDLDMNDARIVSPNGYTPDKTDIFGLVHRLSKPDYEAELVGKSTIKGIEMYILNIKSKSTNELDPKIKYEHIGFDPKDFTVKLWETYDGSGSEPYMRYILTTFNLMDSIPDKTMQL
jgi:outer membrane lipoprotein-sorting protein